MADKGKTDTTKHPELSTGKAEPAETTHHALTRRDLLTVWGYLDVLAGVYRARATAAAAKKDTTGDKLTADYTRNVAELEAIKRKISAAADRMED